MMRINNTIHRQRAAGSTGLHIKDIAVDTGNHIYTTLTLGSGGLVTHRLQTVSIAVLIPVAGNQGRRAAQFNGDGKTGILIRAIGIVNQKYASKSTAANTDKGNDVSSMRMEMNTARAFTNEVFLFIFNYLSSK